MSMIYPLSTSVAATSSAIDSSGPSFRRMIPMRMREPTRADMREETGMAVLISNDAGLSELIDCAEIEAIADHVLSEEGVSSDVEISLSWVDDEEMRELNREWRGIDRPTDVLSFECDDAFDFDPPEGMAVELGDIVLAPSVISAQAPGFGNSPADECRLMLVHGLLHLLGYDHIEDDEAEAMEAREDALLRELAAMRGEDPSSVSVGPITNHAHD